MNAIVPYYPTPDVCTVHLYGKLREHFGKSITVPGSTVNVAVRNILIKNPAIRYVLAQGSYRVVRGDLKTGLDLDEQMLKIQVGPSRQIHIVPVAEGGGGNHGGSLKTILGAVLIVAAVVVAIPSGGTSIAGALAAELPAGLGISAATIVGTIGLFGASLLLQGISVLISPQPGLGASYLINGNLNTVLQGTPVPLVYGRARVGSVVVASSYSAADYTRGTSDYNGAAAYENASGGFSGYLDAFDTGNPLPGNASGKGGGGKASSGGGVEAPNTLESTATISIIDVISEGPITGIVGGAKGIYFNNTPLQNEDGTFNFHGVTWKYLFGTPDQAALAGYPSATENVPVNTQCYHNNPLIQQLQSTTATQARITLELPSLFTTNTQNGDVNPSTLGLTIEVAEVTGSSIGAYSEVISDVINGKCTSAYQKSYLFDLPGSGGGNGAITTWNVRVTKTTPESAVSTSVNQLFWASYDLITNNLIGYEDTAAVALTINAEAFGSTLPTRTYLVDGIQVQTPSNYNAANKSYATSGPGTNAGAWDYASFTSQTTSNPAWILYDFLSNSRYGLGVTAANLETAAMQLYEIAQYCDGLVPDGGGGTEIRYSLNGVLNQPATAFQIMQAIAATFRGTVYWAGGQVCVSADMPAAPVKIYTAANVINGSFVYQGTSLKTRHTMVNSHFTDPLNQYLPGIEPTELPQQVAARGIVSTDILGFGVTSRGLAHRLGNWLLYTENFQTETITFSVGWDSAGVMPGELIEVADPAIAGIRMGGRIRSSSNANFLALDMEFNPVPGQNYTASVILEDGSLAETVSVASFTTATTPQGVTYSIANLSAPLVKPPLSGAVYILQDAVVVPTEWSVVGISETSRGIFEIVAVQYNPDKFSLVEDLPTLNIPSFSTVPAQLTAPLGAPTNVTAITGLAGQGLTTIQETTVSWVAPAPPDPRIVQYQVSVVNSSGTTVAVLTPKGTSVQIDGLSPDTYYFAVRSLGANGSTSPWAYSSPFVVTGQSANMPPAVTNLRASAGFEQVQLNWSASAQSDVLYYLIWRSSTETAPGEPGSLAALIGTTSGDSFADVDSQTLDAGTTWNYWVQPLTTTKVTGYLSESVQVVIAYLTNGAFATNVLPGFVTTIQAVGIWTGAALPTNQGEADGANVIYWSVTGQLYSWNTTSESYISSLTTPADMPGGTLNDNVVIPGSNLTGEIINATIAATNLNGAITPAQLSFTDPTNLCLNPTFTVSGSPSTANWSASAAAEVATTAGIPAQSPSVNVGVQTTPSITYGSPFAVTPGQVFYFAAWVAGSNVNVASIGLTLTDLFNQNPGFHAAASAVPSGAWTLISGQITIPATTNGSASTSQAILTLDVAGTGTLPAVYWTNITCRQAVSNNLLAPSSVTATNIAAATITSTQIAAATITASQMQSGTITATQIAAATITGSNIAGATITGTNILAGSITASNIAAATITAGQIAAGTITTTNLAAGTLSANNITAGVLNAGVVIASIASFGTVQITNANIASLTVQTSNIANSAVSALYYVTGSNSSGSAWTGPSVNVPCNGNEHLVVYFIATGFSGLVYTYPSGGG